MLWQKNLQLPFDKEIVDIVQFGSSIFENAAPNDIDVAVLFKDIPLKTQLETTQKIKRALETHTHLPIHTKAYTYETLFEPSNFARSAIVGYGISLRTKKPFAHHLGLRANSEFSYNLRTFSKTQKVRIHYNLRGKKGAYGILKKVGGSLQKPGLIAVPPQAEKIVENFFTEEKIPYEKKLIFTEL